jgi:hypothetical protein
LGPAALSQTSSSAVLSGSIADPSGARIGHAQLHVHGDAIDRDLVSNEIGAFTLNLPPGTYTVTAQAPGFRVYSRDGLVLRAGHDRDILVRLSLAPQSDAIEVEPTGSTNSGDNRGLFFSGDQLQVLSDDPSTLRQQLLAMAGTGPGLNAPQILVDGFSNGQIPPKASIRSIRINNNPYSAEFDRAGFGRIEVTTQAGGSKLHGSFDTGATDASLNARNPYTGLQPAYHQLFFQGNLNGPLGKKASFFVAGNSTDLQNNAVVNAVVLNPDLTPTTLSQAVSNPQRNDDYSLRLDRQLTASNQITARYEVNRTHLVNGGVGLLVLPSQGFNSDNIVQTLQFSDNDIISPRVVNDARFQYIRTRLRQDPNNASAAVIVQGAFNGGGSPLGAVRDNQDRYELQESLSVDHGKHYIRAGFRYRLLRDSNDSSAGFNGQYIFPDIASFAAGRPSQFSLATGRRSASLVTGDLGFYADDDWRLARDLTLSLGFRFETQSAIADHSDPAPRVGIAWAVRRGKGRTPLLTLRAGAGFFYQRFEGANILQAVRQNGTSQLSFFVPNPSFFSCGSSALNCYVPPASSLTASQPTRYQVDPHLRSAYDFLTSVTAERTIGHMGIITANYLDGRGVHQYVSRNLNAPLPGTGLRPLGNDENLYQFSSAGQSSRRIFFSNLNLNPTRRLTIFAFYVRQRIYSDTNSATGFASNSYNVHQDYGPEDSVPSQQLFTGFSWSLPHGVSLQPFLSARGGRPFNVTTGTDLNGDTLYNDRPAFATDLSRASVVHTAIGTFDTDPLPSQTLVPYNYGRAPAFVWLDLQASEAIHLGPRPRAAVATAPAPMTAQGAARHTPRLDRPWTLTFSVEAQNLFNHRNPGPPVGVLSSPFFGRSISLANDFTSFTAANRSFMLHSSFSF